MTGDVFVSVIIPTYNSEKFIETCLDSLLRQTYSQIEILVIDDGSTDRTLAICDRYSKADNRIRCISQDHAGVACARNKGLEICAGKYVTFVDSDDYVEPNLIEEYLHCMDALHEQGEEAPFIMSGMHVDVYSGTMKDEDKLVEGKERYSSLERSMVAYLCWAKLFNFITNKLYDTEKLKEKDIWFPEHVQIAEDLQFNLLCLERLPGKMGLVNMPLYHYVRHSEESLSLRYYENAIEDTKSIYDRLLAFAKEQEGITEDDILVIKSIYIVDWTSRMTALYEEKQPFMKQMKNRHIVDLEVKSSKFQNMLKEVHENGKISHVRYSALRMKHYGIYCMIRRLYRLLK